jgi:hypothetical protein
MRFVSQILFYIMAVILEDYFKEQMIRLHIMEEEYDKKDMTDLRDHGVSTVKGVSKDIGLPVITEDDEGNMSKAYDQAEADRLEYQYERMRYTIQYMVYK